MSKQAIEAMLEQWARFYYHYDFGGLGYPKRAVMKPIIRSTKPNNDLSIPEYIEQIDKAINQLNQQQKLVLNYEYLKTGKQKEKAQKLEIKLCNYRTSLCRAKKQLIILLESASLH